MCVLYKYTVGCPASRFKESPPRSLSFFSINVLTPPPPARGTLLWPHLMIVIALCVSLFSFHPHPLTPRGLHREETSLPCQGVQRLAWRCTYSVLAFPLKHKCMQTVLLAREIGRLMAWDGDSKNAVNTHFGKVGKIRKAFDYMSALTIDDVLVVIARSPVTLTMTMTPTMTLLPPRNRMIEPEYLFVLVGSVQGIFFFFSMFPQASSVEGTSLTTSLRYQDSRLIVCSWFHFLSGEKPIVFSTKPVDLQACAYPHPLPRSSS
jgi:hypothetical protein